MVRGGLGRSLRGTEALKVKERGEAVFKALELSVNSEISYAWVS